MTDGMMKDTKPNSIVYRSMVLSTLPLAISPTCLEWSGDGQALVVTRSNIYLLTPSAGAPSAGFSSTVVELDKHLGLPWSSHSNAFASVTSSTFDRFWRAAVWSPSALTPLATSLFAALTTNCDVFIFMPTNNHESGLWKNPKAVNVSEILLAHILSIAGDEPETQLSQSPEAVARRARFTAAVLRAQAISIAWSPAAGKEAFERSFLAIGGRRGDLSLWQYKAHGKMEMVAFESVCCDGEAANLLSWSRWQGPQVFLALANSRGHLHVLRIVAGHGQSVQIERQLFYCDPINRSVITNIKWIETENEPILVFTRLGELLACSLSPGSLPHVVPFPSPDSRLDWAGASTSWAPCTGLSVMPGTTDMVISLHNGLLLHATYTPSGVSIDSARSYALSADLRAKFRRLVGRPVTKQDAMNIYGSTLVGNGGVFSWIFEIDAPNLFRYKPENRQSPIFALAPISGYDYDLTRHAERLLQEVVPCSRWAPAARLLPMLLELDSPSEETAQKLTKLLTIDEAETPPLDSLRLRVTLSRLLLHNCPSAALAETHIKLSRLIAWEVIRTLPQTLKPITGADSTTLARYAHASWAIPQPFEPTLPQLLAPEDLSHKLADADRLAVALEGFEEACPACSAPVPFDNIRLAICNTGHVWDRCAITLELLASSRLRVCGGCGRKVGASTEVEETCCLYCGARWRLT